MSERWLTPPPTAVEAVNLVSARRLLVSATAQLDMTDLAAAYIAGVAATLARLEGDGLGGEGSQRARIDED